VLKVLAGLLQHTLVSFYCTWNHITSVSLCAFCGLFSLDCCLRLSVQCNRLPGKTRFFPKWPGMYQDINPNTLAHSVRWHTASNQSIMTLACSSVMNRLDYRNAILYGVTNQNILRLQRVQNRLARVVCSAPYHSPSAPLLQSLHWLPVSHRITYKIAMLTFKTKLHCQPVYLFDILQNYTPIRQLRSSSADLLKRQTTSTKTSDRAFSVAAVKIWNDIPVTVRSATSSEQFARRLFALSFDWWLPILRSLWLIDWINAERRICRAPLYDTSRSASRISWKHDQKVHWVVFEMYLFLFLQNVGLWAGGPQSVSAAGCRNCGNTVWKLFWC